MKHEGQVVRTRVSGPLVSNRISAIRLATLRGLGIAFGDYVSAKLEALSVGAAAATTRAQRSGRRAPRSGR